MTKRIWITKTNNDLRIIMMSLTMTIRMLILPANQVIFLAGKKSIISHDFLAFAA